jgi:hypothetical protein
MRATILSRTFDLFFLSDASVPEPIGVFKFAELARGCADPKVISLR